MPSVTDLYAKIGFKVDDTGLKEFSKEMINLKDTIAECLSGLDGFVQAMKKISSELRTIKTTRALTEDQIKQKEEEKLKRLQLRNKLMEQKLELDPRKLTVAELREERLQESARRRAEGKGSGLSWGVALGNLISEAIISGFKALYGFIKTVVGQLWGVFKTAWQAMTTYRDYRRYTNLRDSELNRWTTFAEGYATRPEIAKNMMDVQQSLVGIRLGQGNLMPYRMLGISADTTNPYEILKQARRAILEQNVAPEYARYLLNQMGFGDWAYAAIMQSKDEGSFQAALKAHDIDTQKQAKLAERLNSILSLLIDSFSQLLEYFSDSSIKSALDYIRDWIIEFVNVFRSGFFKDKGTISSIWNFLSMFTKNPEELRQMKNDDFIIPIKRDAMREATSGSVVYQDNRKTMSVYPTSPVETTDILRAGYESEATEEAAGMASTEDDVLSASNAYYNYSLVSNSTESKVAAARQAVIDRYRQQGMSEEILNKY